MRLERTSQLLADGNDDLHLPLTMTGTSVVSLRGQEATVGDGDTILLTSADRGFVTYPNAVRYTSVSITRKALMPLVPRLEDALMRLRPIRRDNDALRLLRGYANMLSKHPAPATPELRGLVAAHVHDLVALAIGASRDAAAIAEGRGLRVARLH